MRSPSIQPQSAEEFEADEVGVAGEGGGAGVGRVAVAGGAEGQNLPDVLFGLGEEVDELVRGGAEVADAAIRGERGDMEQNAGGTLKFHGLIIDGLGCGGCCGVSGLREVRVTDLWVDQSGRAWGCGIPPMR